MDVYRCPVIFIEHLELPGVECLVNAYIPVFHKAQAGELWIKSTLG